MKVGNLTLNNFQKNFVKELMGDVFMADTRAEARLAVLCAKYDVDAEAMLVAANVRFQHKNEERKKLEAADTQ